MWALQALVEYKVFLMMTQNTGTLGGMSRNPEVIVVTYPAPMIATLKKAAQMRVIIFTYRESTGKMRDELPHRQQEE